MRHYYNVENKPNEHLVMVTIERMKTVTVATCKEQYHAESIVRAMNAYYKEGAR